MNILLDGSIFENSANIIIFIEMRLGVDKKIAHDSEPPDFPGYQRVVSRHCRDLRTLIPKGQAPPRAGRLIVSSPLNTFIEAIWH